MEELKIADRSSLFIYVIVDILCILSLHYGMMYLIVIVDALQFQISDLLVLK